MQALLLLVDNPFQSCVHSPCHNCQIWVLLQMLAVCQNEVHQLLQMHVILIAIPGLHHYQVALLLLHNLQSGCMTVLRLHDM